MVEVILIIVIIVIILKFLEKINIDFANKEKSNTIENNNNDLLQSRDSLNLHLNAIYETYLEMKRNGLAENMIAITLFPTIGRIDNSRIAAGISIQFDGTRFWSYIKNDFIPLLYEVGMYEDFREWKSVGGETGY